MEMERTYLQSRIWLEEPEPNDAFARRAAYCHGYDVFGEMLFLLLRLPGAAAHALEQQGLGHKRFPFYELELDPSGGGRP